MINSIEYFFMHLIAVGVLLLGIARAITDAIEADAKCCSDGEPFRTNVVMVLRALLYGAMMCLFPTIYLAGN